MAEISRNDCFPIGQRHFCISCTFSVNPYLFSLGRFPLHSEIVPTSVNLNFQFTASFFFHNAVVFRIGFAVGKIMEEIEDIADASPHEPNC